MPLKTNSLYQSVAFHLKMLFSTYSRVHYWMTLNTQIMTNTHINVYL